MAYDRDLTHLYPRAAEKFHKLDLRLKQEGLNFLLFEGLRTLKTQEDYYAQGRSYDPVSKSWKVVDPKKVITKAQPGFSFHQYGLAGDYVYDAIINNDKADWSWSDADLLTPGIQPIRWSDLGKLGKECGLEWAGDWKNFQEMPHLQMPVPLPLHVMYEILSTKGLPAVWLALDKSFQ